MIPLDQTVEEIAADLIVYYPHLLSHVNLERIIFNYYDSEKGPPIVINGANRAAQKILSDSDTIERYTIDINVSKIAYHNVIQLQWMVLDILLCISGECDGNIIAHDFRAHSPIVNAICKLNLGASYLTHPDLPPLLGGEEDVEISVF